MGHYFKILAFAIGHCRRLTAITHERPVGARRSGRKTCIRVDVQRGASVL
ncbi:hypothetical protein NBRC3293_0373 [Gluconobacter oxydans NBRC 3293]|uniref:Uncharacterized protein n=1 Tax=Gluconobacter oxydans NBRC 3293 TaxID=1315969 RepID=A0A829WVB9_GLUOY|nr:hypothetical protein NBRC3293_0373 [Gluconobacter oxydans NBRC 3293]